MTETIISPLNKCGYESIWIALNCKNSPLLDKYYMPNMLDLYTLLRYGDCKHPSLFQDKNIIKLYNILSNNLKKEFDNFKNRLENTENGYVPTCYYELISIYFNIEIILMDENNEIRKETIYIQEILRVLKLKPTETIKLCLTTNHVEYIPEKNEIVQYNKLKKDINEIKKKYEETISQTALTDELIIMSHIF